MDPINPPTPTSSSADDDEHGTKRRLSDDSASSGTGKRSKSSRFPSSNRTHKKLKVSTTSSTSAPQPPPPSTTSSSKRSPTISLADGNSTTTASQNVRVVARVRPLSTKEKTENSTEVIRCLPSNNTLLIDGAINKTFEYDAVFSPSSTQAKVYEQTVGNMIRENVIKGFNTTILAYGQTGSGKTFTMGTAGDGQCEKAGSSWQSEALSEPRDEDGIVPRAVYDLFKTKQEMKAVEFKVELAYLEIYNEEIRDLLSSGKEPADIQIRDRDGSVLVTGLTTMEVHSPSDVENWMAEAALRRATGSTAMNAVSSRSHAICTLYVTITPSASPERSPDESRDDADTSMDAADTLTTAEQIFAKLTLVDLAGSERIKRTGAEGARMKEGININKGLFVLGNVISVLSERGQSSDPTNIHVPYRDSKLTRILQDSLGGNSRTVMVACVSPADSNQEESLNTLRYASRTRNIKNSAVRNVVAASMSPAEAAALRRENQMLKLQLAQAQAKLAVSANGSSMPSAEVSYAPQRVSSSPPDCINAESSEIVAGLRAKCSSLETKIEHLEEQLQTAVEDSLTASLRVDRWQLKHERVVATAKAAGVTLSSDHDSESGSGIVDTQRKEIQELKQRLQDAMTDAAVARATAATIMNGNVGLASTETLAWASSSFCDDDEDEGGENDSQETLRSRRAQQEKLTSELVAMNGQIEQKEAMAMKMLMEKECMDQLQSHFEAAVARLQEEVEVLSSERGALLVKLEKQTTSSKGASSKGETEEQKKMRARIAELEKQIRELNMKASEHARAIRLRGAAEKKCEQLAAEIVEDKKRRAALQRRLKEEAEERRSEKRAAKLEAARLLRNSQRLQHELNKVKEAAARQAAVLRRKNMDAIAKQKTLEEQRKRQIASTASRRPPIPKSSSARSFGAEHANADEIEKWLEQEIESASLLRDTQAKIEEQTHQIADAFQRKEQVLSGMNSGQSGGSTSVAIRAVEDEIKSRTRIIEQLQRNTLDLQKFAGQFAVGNTVSVPCSFVDVIKWQEFSLADLRILSSKCFERLLSLREEAENLRSKQDRTMTVAVEAAVSRERRKAEDEIMKLRMEHSETVMTLMESTKGVVEQKVLLQAAEGGVDDSVRSAVDDMLGFYFKGLEKVGKQVRGELQEVKERQDGMKNVVDQVAESLIATNEAAVVQTQTSKKSNARKAVDLEPEVYELPEVEESVLEDSDSDWSPDTPKPEKKRARKTSKSGGSASPGDDENENEQPTALRDLTNEQLRKLCRERGLAVSGNKAMLLSRLSVSMDYIESVMSKENEEEVHRLQRTSIMHPLDRKPLATRNDDLPEKSNNRIFDETVVFSAKKKRGSHDRQKGAPKRKTTVEVLNKTVSETENVL